jgi:hypothetical protein
VKATANMHNDGTLRVDLEDHQQIEAILVDDKGTVAILYRGARFKVKLRARIAGSPVEYGPVEIGPSVQVRLVKEATR